MGKQKGCWQLIGAVGLSLLLCTQVSCSGCGAGGTIKAKLVGEIEVSPRSIPANGQLGAEVTVHVYQAGPERVPVVGAHVEIFSSRNQGGNIVDTIEQPEAPTDAEGRATGYIGSELAGEAGIVAEVDGMPLCSEYIGGECQRAQVMVHFEALCPAGQIACNDVCVDPQTDAENCGGCGVACEFANATGECVGGECVMTCQEGWGDCNYYDGDGCETNLQVDSENCGTCGNICPWGDCVAGQCTGECTDKDGDGFEDAACGGIDCDDTDADIGPNAYEGGAPGSGVCGDGIDNDCDGLTDGDERACASCTDNTDCDDGNACNGEESCVWGECVPGISMNCFDNNECTEERCVPGQGCVYTEVPDGTPCGDQADTECDNPDTCVAGKCEPNLEPPTTVCRPATGGCDAVEYCTGLDGHCPPDDIEPAGTECRPAAGPCDVAEVCDGLSADCPPDEVAPAGIECRAAEGPCDIPEACDGVMVDCPSDGVAPAGTECRPAAGPCDIAEVCDGSAKGCPADFLLPAGTECRPASGPCDVAETCDGLAAGCPADAVAPTSTVCRPSGGVCDVEEYCDGSSKDCPPDALVSAGTECRPAAGLCDVAESCDGTNVDCPPDGYVSAGVVCRAANGACDVEEVCDGAGPLCPPDLVSQAGIVCRPAAGVCDVEEVCDGVGSDCPGDEVAPSGTVCRQAQGECDVTEYCDGVGVYCPADAHVADGTACSSDGLFCNGPERCQGGQCLSSGNPCVNPSDCDEADDNCGSCGDGVLQAGEQCDYGAPRNDNCCDPGTCQWVASGGADPQGVCTSPSECRASVCDGAGGCMVTNLPDGTPCGDPGASGCDDPDTCLAGSCQQNRKPAGTVCRAASGLCDVEEVCDGVNASCPADQVQGAGVVCRSSSGPCDVAEVCNGSSKSCPANGYAAAGTECRAAAGGCDVAEVCPGDGPQCPADVVMSAGTVCRASSGPCDLEETCDGVSPLCPSDSVAPANTVCRPSAGACDVEEVCDGSSKQCPNDVLLSAGTVCRAANGVCDVAEVCDGSSPSCPQDGVAAAGTVCRASQGACDIEEVCDGSSKSCPDNQVAAAGTECRAASGVCDVAEACDGSSADCPSDGVASAGTLCRDSTGECDAAEYCDGSSKDCPADQSVADGTPCSDDGLFCTGTERCQGGVCTSSGNPCSNPADCDEAHDTCGSCGDGIVSTSLGEECDPGPPQDDNCCDVNTCTWVAAGQADPQGVCTTQLECRASVCDGTGGCMLVDLPDGTPCGDQTSDVCDDPDTCLGGACQSNRKPSSTVCRPSAGPCDVAENCDGVNPDCPPDRFASSSTICNPASGPCDVAEYCTGSSASCPADAVADASTVCRASAGPCDPAETCDGINKDCPADQLEPAGTVCRAASGACDVAETCDGANASCPPDAVEPSTTVCRSASGACDRAEYCDGSNKTCPADQVKSAGTECRAASGVCDVAEVCDGSSKTCPADAVAPPTTVCRASGGACDVAEYCDGSNKPCPSDQVKSPGTECRAAADVCDVAEVCDGSSKTCPADAVAPSTQLCRAAADDCDAEEYCDGSNKSCPADGSLPDGTPCTDDNLFCTGAETCQGGVCTSSGNPCSNPADCDEVNDVCGSCGDGIVSPGEDCDPGAPRNDNCCDVSSCTWVASGQTDPQGVCTGAPECKLDVCDGSGGCMVVNAADGSPCGDPSDTACDDPDTCLGGVCQSNLEPAGTVCRPSGGVCDIEEVCDGVNPNCPADSVAPTTRLCRAAAGVCDLEEYCDGSNKDCPSDDLVPPGTECRAASDVCDVAEACDGVNVDCPTDEVESAGVECRASAGACDPAEYCDGVNKACPADVLEPTSTVCRPAAGVCDIAENCDGTNPTCPPDAVEPNSTVCRAATDACDATEYCDGVSVNCPADQSAPAGTPCPDNDPCTDDTCDGNGNCVHQPAADPSSNPNWECIEATCDGVDNDCDGCTDEGCGGGTVASVRVIPYSDGPGLRRISGNAQYGPANRQLPYPLVVQLNDSNGQPMGCEPVTFTVERPGLVCYGKGGTYNASNRTDNPEILRVCNDIEGGSFVGSATVYTDADGQASIYYVLPDAVGMVAISATADNTGEKVFFFESAVGRLSATLHLPPPSPTSNPALGPLDVTQRPGGSSRSFMGNKGNYTLTIDDLVASTGTTNNVPSAPLAAGGTLTITGTQFTDSEPVNGSCGGSPKPGYPRVWIGGVEVTPSSVTNTQIVVPIPEGLPGAASVLVDDGTDTTFKAGSGCVPSRAVAMANFWRVGPSGPPVYLPAETGTLGGGSLLVKVEALDACGNPLSLAGKTVSVWTENPDGSTPSTSVQVGTPDTNGLVTVSALGGGDVRAALIAADVDGTTSTDDDKAVVVVAPQLAPGNYDDTGLTNDDGVNSIIFRGGQEGGSSSETERINPAFRVQTLRVDTYDINWMCTIGLVPACECPASGTALSNTCGSVFETESHLMVATMTGEGDIINMHPDIGNGEASMAGSAVVSFGGGYDETNESGGLLSVVSAQAQYYLPGAPSGYRYGVENVEGSVLVGTVQQSGGEQKIDVMSNGLLLYDDMGNGDPSDDELREIIFRLMCRRAMP